MEKAHDPKFIAITGGPGSGKTAVLEVAQRSLCRHVSVLPESAGIVFGGGFPRGETPASRRASQRAIFHVQDALQRLVLEERAVAIALCDRGTVDGLAYWPDAPDTFWADVRSDLATELARYTAVIHLRTPSVRDGYDHSNPLRKEDNAEALRIDDLIAQAWDGHPAMHVVASDADFLAKVSTSLQLIRAELPLCCRNHGITDGVSLV